MRPPLQAVLLVTVNSSVAVAAGYSVDLDLFNTEFGEVGSLLSGRFVRCEPARRALDLVAGLIAPLERKNYWTIAEHVGHSSPRGLQHLLAQASWDADLVRDDVRDYVVARLLRPGEHAVLVLDETGDVKKGTRSVGCNASTRAPPARSRTPRSRCTRRWSAPGVTPWLTGPCPGFRSWWAHRGR